MSEPRRSGWPPIRWAPKVITAVSALSRYKFPRSAKESPSHHNVAKAAGRYRRWSNRSTVTLSRFCRLTLCRWKRMLVRHKRPSIWQRRPRLSTSPFRSIAPSKANQALEQTRDSVLRYGESIGCELLNFVVLSLLCRLRHGQSAWEICSRSRLQRVLEVGEGGSWRAQTVWARAAAESPEASRDLMRCRAA